VQRNEHAKRNRVIGATVHHALLLAKLF